MGARQAETSPRVGWRWAPVKVAAGALGLTALAWLLSGKTIAPLFRDPVAFFADYIPLNFAGAYSQAGLLCWWTCTVTAGLAWLSGRQSGTMTRRARFLGCAAWATAWLCFDDMFLFHELLAPVWFGLDEIQVFGLYGAATVLLGLAFADVLKASDLRQLAWAMAAFALSVATDLVQHSLEALLGDDLKTLIEDGSKFLGLVLLASWTTALSLEELRAGGS